ncbi:hypothetical protein BGZ83_002595 [Gryganskiella cystojenkinii]|nr:hypothetical protein BGZ83_002595 [Gryganskiella cystojenkinii]
MELPNELLLLLGDHLDRKTLSVSVRINKKWHQVLIPALYKSIGSYHRQPSPEVISQYAHFIRELKINTGHQQMSVLKVYTVFPTQCRHLRELDVTFTRQGHDDQWRTAVLVMQNPGLLQLQIQDTKEMPARPCWSLLLTHCNRFLRHLSLTNVRFSAQDTQILIAVLGPSLVKLSLSHSYLAWPGAFSVEPQFPALKYSWISYTFDTSGQALDWMKQCPSLETLFWNGESGDGGVALSHSLRTLSPRYWSQLQDVTLMNSEVLLSDSQLATLLDACGPLQKLHAFGSKFWQRSLEALERHFATLEKLQLGYCPDVRSWMAQRILSSCPRLTRLGVPVLHVNEIMDGPEAEEAHRQQIQADIEADQRKIEQEIDDDEHTNPDQLRGIIERNRTARETTVQVRPWVCLGLQDLSLFIKFDKKADPSMDRKIFERLATLTELRKISICGEDDEPVPDARGLRFDLESGLDLLTPLKKVDELFLYKFDQHMEERDMRWILAQWPDLTHISSEFNGDRKIRRRLQYLFTEHIRVGISGIPAIVVIASRVGFLGQLWQSCSARHQTPEPCGERSPSRIGTLQPRHYDDDPVQALFG